MFIKDNEQRVIYGNMAYWFFLIHSNEQIVNIQW